MKILPFPSRRHARVITEQEWMNYYQYINTDRCNELAIIGVIAASTVFECGPSGKDQDGTIILGGYEVQADLQAVSPMGEAFAVQLYYYTDEEDKMDAALQLLKVGEAVKIQVNIWSMASTGLVLYLDDLSQVSEVPVYPAEVLRNLTSQSASGVVNHVT